MLSPLGAGAGPKAERDGIRSAAGRVLDPEAVELAVAAAARHEDTRYDELLMRGVDRAQARIEVGDQVARVLERWH